MKTSITFLVFLMLFFSVKLNAQNFARWEFGVVAEQGRDWYHREYYGFESLPPGYTPDFRSNFSSGIGLFTERILNPKFSALAQMSYARKNMPINGFAENSETAAQYYTREIHHRAAIDAGIRWYINPKSTFRFFIDGKAGANFFVSAVKHEISRGNFVFTDAFGYNRMSPEFSGSVGIKWKRLTVSAEHKQDLAPVKRYSTATDIKGRSLVGKVAFTLVRIREH